MSTETTVDRAHVDRREAPIERAFQVFTDDFGSFKPREHNCSRPRSRRPFSNPGSAATSSTGASTAASAVGRVCSPTSRRTGCCSRWDISPHWQLETDPERTSEWEVRFVAELPQRTRVELEHRDLDHHGEGWQGAGRRRGRRRVAAVPSAVR